MTEATYGRVMHRSDLRQPLRRTRRLFLCAALAAPLLVLSACTYRGESDNPVVRRFTWFSYLNGDDIRAACRADTRERYRFVYNA